MFIFGHWEYGPWLIKQNASNNLETLVRASGIVENSTPYAINDGKWHHVALVYDGAEQKTYLDGFLAISAAQTGTLSYLNTPGVLGIATNVQTGPTYTEKLTGLTDGQFLSTSAYTAEEIQRLRLSTYRN
jgi:hypothetical protein